ncbi:2-hydroxy-acid oxidase [Streptacidiphilus sp. PB12-B1b]|uniref:2-hydroxy-acid oxidase n=1 Tax=Streptacidiphilus sp. PB12-B1b TaxID=2705012 RepID=UPI0015FC424C|nr:2-hydroxy-acid oxidase [Streptacidiphilus sp. PB12-B1b]QMU76572.1 2-hydroxy-acid oxidase [Streptacidiphilus sp. PB12-B1b]
MPATGAHTREPYLREPDGRGLRISRVLSRAFDGRSETSLDPDLRVFVSDLARPYGVPLREDLLEQGVGHSYGEMAEGLLRESLPDGEPVDLLVLAVAIPDVRPGRSTAVYLSRYCPGAPLAFAVNDQGPAAAFTALRIAQDYQRTGAARRAAVLVLEQASLHYTPPVPVRVPDGHRAVLLVCEESPVTELSIRQESQVAPGSVAEAVADRLALLGPEAVLVAGPGVGAPPSGSGWGAERTVSAPAGQPMTGVWSELALGLPGWREQRRPVLVADYDPDLGRLGLLAVGLPTAPTHRAAVDTASAATAVIAEPPAVASVAGR